MIEADATFVLNSESTKAGQEWARSDPQVSMTSTMEIVNCLG